MMPSKASLFRDGELADAPSPVETNALAMWNEAAASSGWPRASILTDKRRKGLQRAVQDCGGLAGWKAALARAQKSDFLTGRSGRSGAHANWRPDLEFFLRPAQLLKLIEGGWDNAGPAPTLAPATKTADELWSGYLEGYKPRGWWPTSRGPRPEDPGCQGPPALIKYWREVHKVVMRDRAAETREQRLTGMIASYRKVGYWQKANECEEELARLEGRPAILVPSPDVAQAGKAGAETVSATFVDTRAKRQAPPPKSRADIEREKRDAYMASAAPPEWDAVPEMDDYGEE